MEGRTKEQARDPRKERKEKRTEVGGRLWLASAVFTRPVNKMGHGLVYPYEEIKWL